VNEYNERSFWMRARAILSISDPRWGRSDGNGDRQRPNEPNRGRGNGEGPPDLDEMWREFNRRLSRLFGGKGGGPGPGERRPDNGRAARVGVGIVIGVLVAIYIGSGVFVVQDGQTGVVLQFGKLRRTVGPGVHLRSPYPFETSEIVNVAEIRSVEVGRRNAVNDGNLMDASMLTRDGDILNVRFSVQYQVKSPTDYLFHAVDPDRSVTQAAQAAARAIVGASGTQALLDQNRDQLSQQLATAIQRSLDLYRAGLTVAGVTIQSIEPPQQVQAAFDDALRAKDDRERMKREAQAYANEILPRAQADAARSIDDAKAYAERVVTQAQGDADRFSQVYAQYAKAPAIVRERMYLDTMRDIYSNTTKVFVDTKAGSSVVQLQLDKLIEAKGRGAGDAQAAPGAPAPASSAAAPTQGASAAAPAVASPASRAAAASDAVRSRDGFRSRSREDDLQQ
jgi:modulator of FtsH protease HflK